MVIGGSVEIRVNGPMLKLKIDHREVELSAVGTILKSMANNAKGSVVRATR